MQKIAFDCELIRPGCPIVQAVLGGDSSLCQRFPAETWLTSPTPSMCVYEIEEWRVDLLIALVERRMIDSEVRA